MGRLQILRLSLLAVALFSIPAGVTAQILSKERELISSDEAAVFLPRQSCAKTMRVRVKGSDAFFDADLVRLQRLAGSAGTILSFECENLEMLKINAAGEDGSLIAADATKSNGWRLTVRFNVMDTTEELGALEPSLEALSRAGAIREQAKKAFARFPPQLTRAFIRLETEWQQPLALELLAALAPHTQTGSLQDLYSIRNAVKDFRATYRTAFSKRGLSPELTDAIEAANETWRLSFRNMTAQRFREHLESFDNWEELVGDNVRASLVSDSTFFGETTLRPVVEAAYLKAIDHALAQENVRTRFQSDLDAIAASWDGLTELARMIKPVKKLADPTTPALLAYMESANQRYRSIVENLTNSASQRLVLASNSYADIPQYIEDALNELNNFQALGQTAPVQTLKAAIWKEAERVAQTDFDSYRSHIASLPVSAETIELLKADSYIYSQQAAQIPSFAKYAAFASDQIAPVEQAVVRRAIQTAALHPEQSALEVKAGSESRSLQSLVGAAALNGWLATAGGSSDEGGSGVDPFTLVGWNLSPGPVDSLVFSRVGESGNERLELFFEPQAENLNLVSIAVDAGPREFLEPAAAEGRLLDLTAEPISGYPNSEGVFVADLLAADPADPKRVAPGVAVEEIDFSRAIEASLMALRVEPENPRLSYQLGRLLSLLEEFETAEKLFRKAHGLGYLAASQSLGNMMLGRAGGTEPLLTRERLGLAQQALAFYQAADAAGHPNAGQSIGFAEEVLAQLKPAFTKDQFYEPKIMEAFFYGNLSILEGINPPYIQGYIMRMNDVLNQFSDVPKDRALNAIIRKEMYVSTESMEDTVTQAFGNFAAFIGQLQSDPDALMQQAHQSARAEEGSREDIMTMMNYMSGPEDIAALRDGWREFFENPSVIASDRLKNLIASCVKAGPYAQRLNREYYLNDLQDDEVSDFCECVVYKISSRITEREEAQLLKAFGTLDNLLDRDNALKMNLGSCLR